jgi:hypothetical protein
VHQAVIDKEGNLWLHQNDLWFNCHKSLIERRKHLVFETRVLRQGRPPKDAIPTDVLMATDNEIRTSKIAATPRKTLIAEPAKKWYECSDSKLSHLDWKIELLFDETDSNTFNGKMHFEIASDGGHDPKSGISTFGWVVAVNKQLIAKGRGPVEVHPQLAESFRAEGYGLAAAGLFIKNLLKKFAITPESHSWKVYIDNKSLIQRMTTYDEHLPIARWNLRPDEDISRFAWETWKEVPHKLIHIKSHQDVNTERDKLTFPALLNVIADEQATRHRNLMQQPASDVRNLARVQLQINNIAITRDSQHWIRKTAGRIPIQQYYCEKHEWTRHTFESIHWDVQKKVLTALPAADQTRIVKFVHGWLPTQRRLHREGLATSPRCPLCTALVEDSMHLFACQHPKMKSVQDKLALYLAKSLHDHGNSELINILEIGLSSSIMTTWRMNINVVSEEWREAIQEQNSIGWEQIYKGRMGRKLIEAMDRHYDLVGVNKLQYNGERWAKRLISNIWSTALELWSTRSEILYATSEEVKTKQMQEKVEKRIQRCYEVRHKLSASERQQWFSQTTAELLQKDQKYIQAWINRVERLIRITKREEKTRPPESRIMEKFLTIPITRQHLPRVSQRKKRKPQSLAQDMRPD